MDVNTIRKYDSRDMHKVYDLWPEIAQKNYEKDFDEIDFGDISHIVFAGMGGSGALGDIFSSILSKTDIHVDVVKGYLLPKTVNSETVVVATSVSGNTEETLNVLSSAVKLDSKVIAFSDNGKMREFCRKKNVEHRKIPIMHSPRASFPAFLFSMLKVLEPFLPIEKKDIINSITTLKKQKEVIGSQCLSEKNPSFSIAKWISDIPLIYYPWGLQAAAIRFKNSLQENAKMHVITEDIIEASHNGIVAWNHPSKIKPILIQGDDDYIKTKERWDIIKEFFQEKNIDYLEINSVKGDILSKLINLIYLVDYATIYRAIMSEIDPTPVEAIDFIKKKLNDET